MGAPSAYLVTAATVYIGSTAPRPAMISLYRSGVAHTVGPDGGPMAQ
jgi:hypothetical protein